MPMTVKGADHKSDEAGTSRDEAGMSRDECADAWDESASHELLDCISAVGDRRSSAVRDHCYRLR